jgi:phage baseplate assembly protein W
MTIDFPYHIDGRGRTATTTTTDHIGDLIQQVLFTTPGERVMRPTFGSGLLGLTFEPASTEVATTIQFVVQSALTQQLGDIVTVNNVDVNAGDPSGIAAGASISIAVTWTINTTGATGSGTFVIPGGTP